MPEDVYGSKVLPANGELARDPGETGGRMPAQSFRTDSELSLRSAEQVYRMFAGWMISETADVRRPDNRRAGLDVGQP
jgi:hypothetical protein